MGNSLAGEATRESTSGIPIVDDGKTSAGRRKIPFLRVGGAGNFAPSGESSTDSRHLAPGEESFLFVSEQFNVPHGSLRWREKPAHKSVHRCITSARGFVPLPFEHSSH